MSDGRGHRITPEIIAFGLDFLAEVGTRVPEFYEYPHHDSWELHEALEAATADFDTKFCQNLSFAELSQGRRCIQCYDWISAGINRSMITYGECGPKYFISKDALESRARRPGPEFQPKMAQFAERFLEELARTKEEALDYR